jgi:hypothetical protein
LFASYGVPMTLTYPYTTVIRHVRQRGGRHKPPLRIRRRVAIAVAAGLVMWAVAIIATNPGRSTMVVVERGYPPVTSTAPPAAPTSMPPPVRPPVQRQPPAKPKPRRPSPAPIYVVPAIIPDLVEPPARSTHPQKPRHTSGKTKHHTNDKRRRHDPHKEPATRRHTRDRGQRVEPVPVLVNSRHHRVTYYRHLIVTSTAIIARYRAGSPTAAVG